MLNPLPTGLARISLGAVLTAGGVFAPFYSLPLMGETSLIEVSKPAGLILLALAVLSLILGLTGRGWRAALSGLATMALSGLCVMQFFTKLDTTEAKFSRFFLGSVGRFLTDKVHLSWGIGVVALGGLLVLSGALAMVGASRKAKHRAKVEAKTSALAA